MKVTCAAADEAAFRDLGFQPVELRGAIVILEDTTAPNSDDGDLPWSAVYHGSHGPGIHYDGAMFACTGQAFASVAVGRDGGIVVHLESDGSVRPSDLEEWLRFVTIRDEVMATLAALEAQSEPTPLLPALPELERQAASIACRDPWIMEMLRQSADEWVSSIQGSLSRELTEKEKDQLISAYKAGHFKAGLDHPSILATEPEILAYEI